MSYPSNERWNNDRYGFEPPRSSKVPMIIGLLIFAGFGIVAIVGLAALYVVMERFPLTVGAEKVPAELDTAQPAHEVDWATIKRGFAAADPVADARQVARVQRLLTEFLRCGNEEDLAGLRKVVDYSRFLREMRKTRFQPLIDDYDRSSVMHDLIDSLRAISGWQRVSIVGIEKLPQRGEMMVYAHGFHADGFSNPARFWVADRGRLMVFDWEMTEYGSRETGDYAVYYAYSNDRRMDAYYSAMDKFSEAETQRLEGNVATAKDKLREIADAAVPPLLQDQLRLRVAYRFLSWSDDAAAQAQVARVASPDQLPGYYIVAAQAHRNARETKACFAVLDKFEALVGPTPQSLTLRAECYENEEHWDDATAQYAQMVEQLPNDTGLLQKWGNMLGEENKGPLVKHVEGMKNSTAIAMELAQHFADYGDIDAALAMGDLLRNDPAHAAWLHYLGAAEKQADADYAGAAELYQRAQRESQDNALREKAASAWLTAMALDDKMLQAYQGSSDAREALLHFVGGYEDGEAWADAQEFAALVAAHRQRQPDDPWGIYYAAVAAADAERYEEAAQLAREGLAKLDEIVASEEEESEGESNAEDYEYLRELLDGRLLSALCEDGKAIIAYATLPPADETFTALANLLRYDKDDAPQLKELVATHAAAHPDDPWIAYYQAIVAQHEGKLAEADQLLAQASFSDAVQQDEHLTASYRALWRAVRLAAERRIDALRDIPPLDETLDYFARPLYSEHDWSGLTELLDYYAGVQGRADVRYIYWQQKLLSGTSNDAGLAELLSPWPAEQVWQNWEVAAVRSDLVAALLRLGRNDEAREVVLQYPDDDNAKLSLVLIHLAAGERDKAKELLQQQLAIDAQQCYSFESLQAEVWGEEFADLRRIHPPSLRRPYAWGDAVVLCEQPTFKLDAVAPLIQSIAADAQITPISAENGAAPQSVVVRTKDWQAALCWGDDRFQQEDAYVVRELDDPLRTAWQKHAAWLTIDVVQPSEIAKAEEIACRLAAAVAANEAVSLVFVKDHLLPANKTTRELLTRNPSSDSLSDSGAQVWIYREADDDEETSWNRRRVLRELDRQFQAGLDAAEFFVQVEIHCGQAVERPWLKLVRIIRPGHRQREFVGEFVSASALDTRFAVGEHVHLSAYEIVNWKRVAGDEVSFGRKVE